MCNLYFKELIRSLGYGQYEISDLFYYVSHRTLCKWVFEVLTDKYHVLTRILWHL